MAGKVIALASSKGGAGKTTTGATLAAALEARGLKIIVLDADPQKHFSLWTKKTARLRGIKLNDTDREWAVGGITVIREVAETEMIDIIAEAASRADVVLVDLQGSANQAMLFAMMRSDLVIVPCNSSGFDSDGALNTLARAIAAGKGIGKEIKVAVSLNRTNPSCKTVSDAYVREELKRQGAIILDKELKQYQAIKVAVTFRGGMPDPDIKAERAAWEVVQEFADEISNLVGLPISELKEAS
jgi:chromosome partitioning protein